MSVVGSSAIEFALSATSDFVRLPSIVMSVSFDLGAQATFSRPPTGHTPCATEMRTGLGVDLD